VAATRRPGWRRGKLPWIAAGLGALAARNTHAQSNLDFRYLYYKESDGRTQVLNPWVYLYNDFGLKGGALSLLLGYDTITGASPTGGYPTLDGTTSASGAASSSIPLATYNDTRKSATLSYARKFGAHLPSVDLSYSVENDYLARSVGMSDAWTVAQGRDTLHVGVSFSRDVVTPVTTGVSRDKSSNALALGWSHILGERDLLDLSGSITKLSGYLDDPYKIVPVGATTLPEHRPDARSRQAVLVKYAHHLVRTRAAFKTSYRYYWDNWAVRANTLWLAYEQRAGEKWILTPELRLYTQTSASFFAWEFAVPRRNMSSDYRLSALDSVLAGLTVSYQIRKDLVLTVGATYQDQQGRDRVAPHGVAPPAVAPTPLAEDDDGDDAIGGGPALVSAADLKIVTGTLGLSWRY
jgi:hypothetical protein